MKSSIQFTSPYKSRRILMHARLWSSWCLANDPTACLIVSEAFCCRADHILESEMANTRELQDFPGSISSPFKLNFILPPSTFVEQIRSVPSLLEKKLLHEMSRPFFFVIKNINRISTLCVNPKKERHAANSWSRRRCHATASMHYNASACRSITHNDFTTCSFPSRGYLQ